MPFLAWLKSFFVSAPAAYVSAVGSLPKLVHTTSGGQPVFVDSLNGIPKALRFKGCARDDGDGALSSHGDKDYQRTTSVLHNGAYLNADLIPFVVFYSWMVAACAGHAIPGCLVLVTRISTGKRFWAIAGDEGPYGGRGEISTAAETLAGEPASPVYGGTGALDFEFVFYPGVMAVINGSTVLPPAGFPC